MPRFGGGVVRIRAQPRARFPRATADMPMDEAPPGCDLGRIVDLRPTLPDEVHGARAVGSLVVGDLEAAAAELGSVRTRYLVGFLVRLAMLMPTVSMRLAWRIGAQRWFAPGPRGRR